jgi:hypothetical protein
VTYFEGKEERTERERVGDPLMMPSLQHNLEKLKEDGGWVRIVREGKKRRGRGAIFFFFFVGFRERI